MINLSGQRVCSPLMPTRNTRSNDTRRRRARNMRPWTTQDASTQYSEQLAKQLAGAPSLAPPNSQCAAKRLGIAGTFRSHRFQRRLPMLLPLHPPMHMVQHRTGAHRVNSTDSDHAERCRNPIKCESTDTSGNQTVLQPQPVPAQREGWPAWAVPPKLVHQSGPRHRPVLARRERQSQAKRL